MIELLKPTLALFSEILKNFFSPFLCRLSIDKEPGRIHGLQAGRVVDLLLAGAPIKAFVRAHFKLAGGIVAGVTDHTALIEDRFDISQVIDLAIVDFNRYRLRCFGHTTYNNTAGKQCQDKKVFHVTSSKQIDQHFEGELLDLEYTARKGARTDLSRPPVQKRLYQRQQHITDVAFHSASLERPFVHDLSNRFSVRHRACQSFAVSTAQHPGSHDAD